jgi:hypothetical protein
MDHFGSIATFTLFLYAMMNWKNSVITILGIDVDYTTPIMSISHRTQHCGGETEESTLTEQKERRN